MAEPEEYQEAWYAVFTNARQEWFANHRLIQDGLETLYLYYRDTASHARKTVELPYPYFSRYLFVKARLDQIYRVNKTQGVSTVVYAGEQPLEVPGYVIEELRARGNKDGCVSITKEEKVRRRLRRGQTVKITTGPFTGLLAEVSLDKGGAVHVWLEMFKRRKKVSFLPEHLSPAGAAR